MCKPRVRRKCGCCAVSFQTKVRDKIICDLCKRMIGKKRCEKCGVIVLSGVICRSCRRVKNRWGGKTDYDGIDYNFQERIPHKRFYNLVVSKTLIWKSNPSYGPCWIGVEPSYKIPNICLIVFSNQDGRHINVFESLGINEHVAGIIIAYYL